MNSWQAGKRASDVYMPYVKQILGLHLIDEAPVEEDQQRNTDLTVLTLGAIRVDVRIRSYEKYYADYPTEFTIRAILPSGTKTELAKIIEGWGDYMFYGFGVPETKKVPAWYLLRLNVFRAYYTDYIRDNCGAEPGQLLHNGDGSKFRAYDIRELPDRLICAKRVPPVPEPAQGALALIVPASASKATA